MNRAEYDTRRTEFSARGMDLPQTKLHPRDVIAIREAAKKRAKLRKRINDKYSNSALAKKWGVHESTIEKVLSYATARHVP